MRHIVQRSAREFHRLGVYLAAIVAGLMLAFGEGSLFPAALVLPIGIAAYILLEWSGKRGLNDAWAGILGLVALAVSLGELLVRDIEGRLLFGAHLLAYLTWIFLWQEKQSRQLWGLLALSVLQVAVGSVLTSSPLYGLGLLFFLNLMVWTLTAAQLADADRNRKGIANNDSATVEHGGSEKVLSTKPFTRLPHKAVQPSVLLERPRLLAESRGSRGLRSPPWSAVCITVSAAVVMGLIFFFFIPRVEVGRGTFNDYEGPLARQRITGFSDRVKLGEFGQILESNQPVFEVRMFESETDVAVDVLEHANSVGQDEPYFRGITLDTYYRGEWSNGQFNSPEDLATSPLQQTIRQEYRLKTDGDTLFAFAPIYTGHLNSHDEPIRMRMSDRTLVRPRDSRRKSELSYTLYSPKTGGQIRRFRDRLRLGIGYNDSYSTRNRRFLQLPDGLDELIAESRLVTASLADIPPNPTSPREVNRYIWSRPVDNDSPQRLRVAEALVSHLRDSGKFRYSLNGSVTDSSIDPVVDFLKNRRSGHCEYFAAALALMLRAEGIPSRIVNGFKGGVTNDLTGAFQVQQRHAHSWVEAYIEGEWLRFDATPAEARSRDVASHADSVQMLRRLTDAAGNLWQEYVVQLTLSRQRKVLTPVTVQAQKLSQQVANSFGPERREEVWRFITTPERWISWQGGVTSFLLLTTLALGGRWLLRVRQRRAARRDGSRHRCENQHVAFYQKFRQLCRRRGWQESDGQTSREFAESVAGELASHNLASTLQTVPEELTRRFYAVRFGGHTLDDHELADVEQRLDQLEEGLAQSSRTDRS